MSNYEYKMGPDEVLYYEMKRKSLEGEVAKRTGEKKEIEKKKRNRALTKIALVSISAMIAINGFNAVVGDKLKDNAIINPLISDYQEEVISEATHRTEDGTNYYFDYEELGKHIEESDDLQRDAYFTYINISSKNLADTKDQLNQIFGYTSFGSFDAYLISRGYENGYDDRDIYAKEEEQRIIEREKRHQEVEEMQEKENSEVVEGEKSL